jgi:YYY domain-containing protein
MDFLLLNSVLSTEIGIPQDAWMKGESISYYYFGYWIIGIYSKLIGTPSAIAYNIALAIIPSLTASTVIGLTLAIINPIKKNNKFAFIASILSGFICVFLANLFAPLKFLLDNAIGGIKFWKFICVEGMTYTGSTLSDSWRPIEFWWWFKSSRIINYRGSGCDQIGTDYTINEFPFFSYLLGDLHPHLISTPFFIVLLAISLQIVRHKNKTNINKLNVLKGILFGIVIGSVIFINTWNVIICAVIICGIFVMKYGTHRKFPLNDLIIWIMIPVLSLIVFLIPFLSSFNSSITGLKSTKTQTSLIHGLIIWGPLFILIFPLLMRQIFETAISKNWKLPLLGSVILSSIPIFIRFIVSDSSESEGPGFFPFAITLYISSIIAFTYSLIHLREQGTSSNCIFLGLLGIALVLIYTPEFFYIGDMFQNRMNTIFKFYYQAWVILSIVAGYSIFKFLIDLNRKNIHFNKYTSFFTIFLLSIVVSGFYFAPSSLSTKISESEFKGLNGMEHIKQYTPHVYEAIIFSKEHIDPESGILESVGEWGDAGIISTNTGIQNIINWPGHEKQWRGTIQSIEERIDDVNTIYLTLDNGTAIKLLKKYNVKYIFIGLKELNKYDKKYLEKFASFGTLIFTSTHNSETLKIYQIYD